MVCVKSSRALSSWLGWSSAVLIAALPAAAPFPAHSLHAASGLTQGAPTPAATAIINARIIDGSGNAPFEGTVVMNGDRIAEVGRSVKPPEGARVIDAQGGTVMPGLVDLVVEFPRGAANDVLARVAAAYLYAGVTTIVPAGLSAAEIDASRTGLLRAGHKSPRLALPAAPERLVRGGASGGSLADAQQFTEWRQNNATYVPVLAAVAPAENRKPTSIFEAFSGAAASGGAGNGAADAGTADPGRWKALVDQTRSARDAGIRLGLGSGGGAQGLPHGWSSLLAVRLFVDAGITPLQAVTAATSGGAWALGVQSDRGFLAVGQRADLVVVSGDPSSSIGDIEKIAHVIFGGEVLDRAALRAAIAGAPAPASPEPTTAAVAGGKPSSPAAPAAGTSAPTAASNAPAATATAANPPAAPATVDPKTPGAKPTARERAAARGKRGAPVAGSPESTSATAENPAATPGASAAAPTASGAASPTTGSSSSAAPLSGSPSTVAPASPSAAGSVPSTAGSGAPGASPSGSAPGAASSPLNVASANPASPAAVPAMAAAIVAASPMIDDFEGGRDASTVGSAWSSAAESSTTSTTVVMGRVVRGARDHALNVTARMGEARDSHARVTVSVAQNGRPLDVSRFHGLRFDARGQGRYRIMFISRSVTDGRYHESNFSGSPLWTPVNIPFASVGQSGKGERTPWTGRDLVEIVFVFNRDPGDFGYLELDNVRFY